ncbi:MAG: hypothetical protein WC498_01815 [Candidatus Saccharimonadales bacterium]
MKESAPSTNQTHEVSDDASKDTDFYVRLAAEDIQADPAGDTDGVKAFFRTTVKERLEIPRHDLHHNPDIDNLPHP